MAGHRTGPVHVVRARPGAGKGAIVADTRLCIAANPAAEQISLSAVLENTIVGIGALVDRRFVWVNARMAEIFGYEPDELVGESVRCFYVNEEDYLAVGHAYELLAQQSFYTHEHPQVRKSGEIIWCRISGRIVNPGAASPMSVWVVQDLTDKKRAEDQLRRVNHQLEQTVVRRTMTLSRTIVALRAEIERRRQAQLLSTESRNKYRALFSTLPLGVLVTNAAGEVIEANRTMQTSIGVATGAALAPALADTTRVLLEGGLSTSLAALVREQKFKEPRRPRRFEFRWIAGDGTRRDMFAVAVPLSANGLGAMITCSDITEQRASREREHQQRDELARASRLSLMGQMTSAIAHELGQPLNVCQSYLTGIRHRLAAELPPESEINRALDKAIEQLVQAGQIIRNVRDFVSLREPKFEDVYLHDLVAQTLQLLDVSLRNSGVSVELDVHPSARSRPAHCHPVAIQQVLVNLIINAIEALQSNAPADRRIAIRLAAAARSMLLVRVNDNGPGVRAELASRLFEPYVTSKPGGLGMGLMISRTIIENHGGKLKLAPQEGGRGSAFTFTVRSGAARE